MPLPFDTCEWPLVECVAVATTALVIKAAYTFPEIRVNIQYPYKSPMVSGMVYFYYLR